MTTFVATHAHRPRWARRAVGIAAAAALVTGLGLGGGAAGAAPAPSSPAPGGPAAQTADSAGGIAGLPSGVPPAATAPLPTLPAPAASAWPFPNDWSPTEGSGRYAGGAYFWTDFVYDDHGAAGSGTGDSASGLAPDHGTYTYPSGPGYDEGNADIFGPAVGDDGTASYWRVDWASMPDPTIPIAEWTIAVPGATPTATTWPAGAGVQTSTGFADALVVTSAGAQLVDATGAITHTFPTTVDPNSYSFIVRIPHSVLAVPAAGSWDVQLASGLNATPGAAPGTAHYSFAPALGAVSGGANVYNITFRSSGPAGDEQQLVCPDYPYDPNVAATLEQGLANQGSAQPGVPTVACANNWMENDQANTLRTVTPGVAPDVAKYRQQIDWGTIADRATPTVPVQAGYSNRWYVTPLFGQPGSPITGGMRAADSATYTGPTYLDRVQVYAVDVPQAYADAVNSGHATPTPLTWILHSLGANLNQYGGTDPTQVAQECDDRGNICATTEGFSEGEWYYGEAEVDFFDVWHALASSFDLDPDATTLSGYSMGGWASYKLAEEYPSLFAQAMPLEGPVICGDESAPSTSATPYVGSTASSSGTFSGYGAGAQCNSDADTAAAAPASVQRSAPPNPAVPLGPADDPLGALDNLYWIPYAMTCGAVDELVPFTGCQTEAQRLEADGLQLFDASYPTEDHLVFATQNDFTPTDTALAPSPRRVADPGHFSYTWYPDLAGDLAASPSGVDGIGAAGQVGPTGAYWVRGLVGSSTTPGATAAVVADSAAIPDPAVTYVDSTTPEAQASPTPYLAIRQTRQLGATPAPRQSATVALANVAAATVDTAGAGLSCGTLAATTDGPTALTLASLQPGSPVTAGARTLTTADAAGTAVVSLAAGTTTLALCSTLSGSGPVPSTPEAPLVVGLPLAAVAAAYGVHRLRRSRSRA
ncbi:MAG TPA: hypothetical protein VFP61_02550 [Acidimicrobiales bacterium]|nr:hypothetical protein [Acidimicrobiales bacterium]